MEVSTFFIIIIGLHAVTLLVVLKLAVNQKTTKSTQTQAVAGALKKVQTVALEQNTQLLNELEHIFQRHYHDLGKEVLTTNKEFLEKIKQDWQADRTVFQKSWQNELAASSAALQEQMKSGYSKAEQDIATWKEIQIAEYEKTSAHALKEIVGKSVAVHLDSDQHHQLVKTALERAWNEGALHDD